MNEPKRQYLSQREQFALNARPQVTLTDGELLALTDLIRDNNEKIARAMNAEPASRGSYGAIVNFVEGRMTFEQKLRFKKAVADGTHMDQSKWTSMGIVQLAVTS